MKIALPEDHPVVKDCVQMLTAVREVLGFEVTPTQLARSMFRILNDADAQILTLLREGAPPKNPPKGDADRRDEFELWLSQLLRKAIVDHTSPHAVPRSTSATLAPPRTHSAS